MAIPSLLAGVAGEYFVAAELSRRGYIASISLRNTRGIDILATNQDATRSITIQCKTNQLGLGTWILNEKCEEYISKDHFYIFVSFRDLLVRPQYYIVPSHDVATQTRTTHRIWLEALGRKGQKRADTPMRKFSDAKEVYLEKWDLLGL